MLVNFLNCEKLIKFYFLPRLQLFIEIQCHFVCDIVYSTPTKGKTQYSLNVGNFDMWEKELIIGVQWGQKKSQPTGPLFQWETRQSLISPRNGGPSGWDFFCPHWTSMMDSLCKSTIAQFWEIWKFSYFYTLHIRDLRIIPEGQSITM